MIPIDSTLTDYKKFLSDDTIQRLPYRLNNNPIKIFRISNHQLESIKQAKQQVSDGEVIDNNERPLQNSVSLALLSLRYESL